MTHRSTKREERAQKSAQQRAKRALKSNAELTIQDLRRLCEEKLCRWWNNNRLQLAFQTHGHPTVIKGVAYFVASWRDGFNGRRYQVMCTPAIGSKEISSFGETKAKGVVWYQSLAGAQAVINNLKEQSHG